MNEELDRGIAKIEELIKKYPYMTDVNMVLKQVKIVFQAMKGSDIDE